MKSVVPNGQIHHGNLLELRLDIYYITAYRKSFGTLVCNGWKEYRWMFIPDYGKRGQMTLYLESIPSIIDQNSRH